MLPVTLQDGEKLIALQEIVYAFESGSGCELITISTPEKSIEIREDVSVVRAAGLAAITVMGFRYAVNPTNCREVIPSEDGGAVIVTRRGKIKADVYADTLIAFAAVSSTGGLSVSGPYTGDTMAAAAGVALGQAYRLSVVNDYDLPSPQARLVVARIV